MKLYHFPGSSNSRKATMTAELLGLSVDMELVDLTRGAQKSPEFLKINPNGRVPALVDGDFRLWESHAIMTYLASGSENAIYPHRDRRARADVDRWLFWSANHWGVAVSMLNFENMLKKMFGMGEPDPAQVARAEGFFTDFAAVLDAHLGGRDFVCGDGVTLADVALACPLMYAETARLPLDGRENIRRWFSGIEALDAWKQTTPPPMG